MTLFENDIAVMKVKNASTLQCRQDSIWPACLPNKETNYAENSKAIVSGWGKVEGNEQINITIPRVLRKTEVSIVSDTECSDNVISQPEYSEYDTSLFISLIHRYLTSKSVQEI